MYDVKNVLICEKSEFVSRLSRVQPFVEYMKSLVYKLDQCGELNREDIISFCLADDTAAWVCGRIAEANFVTFRLSVNSFKRQSPTLLREGFDQSFEQQLFGEKWSNLTYYNGLILPNVALKLIVYCVKNVCQELNTTNCGDHAKLASQLRNIEYSNPCPQLSYFVHLDNVLRSTKCGENRNDYSIVTDNVFPTETNRCKKASLPRVTSRDCQCLRTIIKATSNDFVEQTDEYIRLLFDVRPFDVNDSYHRSLAVLEELIEEPHDDAIVSINSCQCYVQTK
ncbi:lef-12 [Sucra jujuba nucleopolyhedrovirus]|uniref:Lef-12 n=1 Tax=Sucra jujuba nucleopolyhedrovirus TaxID=1563660 RepID=A0A097P8W4_9ABAC|nr:lef-12 [Sucra jujuba nucleopolyhedrovirus]AIU41271.1 lef-12 [Sucra jujuba nucleopolyhedrovirus]